MALTDENGSNGMIMPVAPLGYGGGYGNQGGFGFGGDWAWILLLLVLGGTVSAISNSEFSNAIYGKDPEDVLRVMDDLMKSVEYFNPKLHKATIQKLKQL